MTDSRFIVSIRNEGGIFRKKPVVTLTRAVCLDKYSCTVALREGDIIEIPHTFPYPKVIRKERV